jgi:hypothetical protein
MPRLEKDLEEDCCHIGWYEFGLMNLKQISEKGLPDRLFFKAVTSKSGKTRKVTAFFVEFKDLGKKARKYQTHIHKHLRRSGISVYTDIDDEDQFRDICDEEVHS